MVQFFFIGVALLIISLLGAYLNMRVGVKQFAMNENTVVINLLCGAMYIIGAVMAVISAVIWIIEKSV